MVDYTGDPERDASAEAQAAIDLIKAGREMRLDAARKRDDPNCYLVLVFQHVDQRNEFAEKAGWNTKYAPFIDGLDVAKRLGIDIKAELVPLPKPFTLPAPLRKGIKIDA